MQCPNDGTVLQMTERQGVEIDYCPNCRGIWLDRGELDKILERTRLDDDDRYDDDRYDDDRRRGYPPDAPRSGGYESYPSGQHPQRKRKKRGSFLEDLLDFG
jgi:Zn-finger nucleic acid-binding protein